MNLPTPPDTAEVEWALQERAREEEALKIAAGSTVRLNRYRLIARVLMEPLRERLPRGLTESILASATAPRSADALHLGAVMTAIGGTYVVAMTAASILTQTDIRHALVAPGPPIALIAIAIVLSLAAERAISVIRLFRSSPGTRA